MRRDQSVAGIPPGGSAAARILHMSPRQNPPNDQLHFLDESGTKEKPPDESSGLSHHKPLPTPQNAKRKANCMKRGVVSVEWYLPNCDGLVGERGLRAAHVIAHRVSGVERLPTELQTPLLTQREILATPVSILNMPSPMTLLRTPDSPGQSGRNAACAATRIGEDVGPAHAIHDDVLGVGRHRRRPVRHRHHPRCSSWWPR